MIIGSTVCQSAARMGNIEGYEELITIDNYLESVNQLLDLGYQQIELILDPMLYAMEEDDLKKLMIELKKIKEEFGIKYSVHLPFWWVNVTYPKEKMRQSSVDIMKDCIELTNPLQPTHFVLHVYQNIFNRVEKSLIRENLKNKSRKRIIKYAQESIEEILTVLDNSRQLAIENLLNSEIDLLLNLVEKYNTSFCYDIGHKYMAEMDELSFLKKHKDRIKSIHSHNIRLKQIDQNRPRIYKMEDHYSISRGSIDFDRVLKTLQSIGYDDTLIIEVKRYKDAVESAEYLKEKGFL